MVLTALYWLLVLELFGLASFPLAFRAFSRLPERGWVLSKPLGLLLVGVVTWLIGLSHLLVNSRLSVALALAVVVLLSWRAARGRGGEIRAFLRAHAVVVLTTELLFIAVFLGVAALRAAVSDISGTEQPWDFMMLNAVVASPYYPPNDPWFAGEPVSYYYLGYLLIGAVTLLTGTATPVAYNLGLATVAALGGVAAFGLTFNLIRLARGSFDGAVLGGLAATFLLLIASNMSGALELGRAAGAGDAAFWESVGIDGLTAPSAPSSTWHPDGAWWWRASRVSTVTSAGPEAITEFPLFSFILGDLHPHVMSIGFLLLAAALAVQVYLQPDILRLRALRREWPLVLVVTVGVGALGAINVSDLPVGFAMLAGAILLNAARHERSMRFGSALAVQGDTAIVGAPSDPDRAPGEGSAFVYERRGHRWHRTTRLGPVDTHAGASFGTSVSLSGDLAVIGAPASNAVYVYGFADEHWHQLATIRSPDGVREFGRAVAVDDDTIAVGAAGAVHTYNGRGRLWSLTSELTADGAGAAFGSALALAGGTLAVGSPGPHGGSVHVFARRGAAWSRTAVTLSTDAGSGMGRSVALADGSLVVGAEWRALVFERRGSAWEQTAALEPPGADESFGTSVAIDQRYLVVGADQEHSPAANAGAAYVYARSDAGWAIHDKLRAGDAGIDAGFGASVAIDGDTVVAGTPGSGHGAAYAFERTLDDWHLRWKLVSRWRFGRVLLALGLLAAGILFLLVPFLLTFESSASGILPLRGLLTTPLHLLLIWGVSGFLVLPVFFLAMPSVFRRGNWSLMRFGIALFIGFGPVALWLQPVWGPPFFVVALLFNGLVVMLFGLHRAGYRLPRVDEMSFAINSGVTRIVGTLLLVALLIGDGVLHGERGIDGQFLAVGRLLIVVPMALVVSLSIYGAWTLAHRDSEAARQGNTGSDAPQQSDGIVPFLLLLAVASALIMGVELFHIVDAFGGLLRRMNTVFKLYYQAWLLMAVLGGFSLWYVGSRWDRRVLVGRLGVTAWATVLVLGFGALSYYPMAAITTRTAGSALDLDGQAYLLRLNPAEHEAIQWVRGNVPRDAIVLEAAVVPCPDSPDGCSSYREAGRIASSTGRPTVLGWEGHERQWGRDGADLVARRNDVRTIYETADDDLARALLAKYGVTYVVVGPRERASYGVDGVAKFGRLGTPEFGDGGAVTVYWVGAGGLS